MSLLNKIQDNLNPLYSGIWQTGSPGNGIRQQLPDTVCRNPGKYHVKEIVSLKSFWQSGSLGISLPDYLIPERGLSSYELYLFVKSYGYIWNILILIVLIVW